MYICNLITLISKGSQLSSTLDDLAYPADIHTYTYVCITGSLLCIFGYTNTFLCTHACTYVRTYMDFRLHSFSGKNLS